jgi:riboflavin synthase
MFTGLIEAVGKLVARTARGPGARLVIAAPFMSEQEQEPLVLGESISVNGVCLTVDTTTKDGFEADASAETLAKTTLGALSLGARLNLERALRLDARLGGHIVSGHVDGVGALVSREKMGDAERVVFRAPKELLRFIAAKGSIAINGISLTVNDVESDMFSVAIIPRTNKETQLGDVPSEGPVNLEIDLLARYVLRLIEAPHERTAAEKDASLLELLKKNGYV